ncbi:MAG: hypothetical protein AB7O59_06705 [Pirellulales bacterium]
MELREKIVESSEKFIPETDEAITLLEQTLKTLSTSEEIQGLLAERAKFNGRA